MGICFTCDFCGKEFNVDETLAGKKAKCKDCGNVFPIPGARISAVSPRRPSGSGRRVPPESVRDSAPRPGRSASPSQPAASVAPPPSWANDLFDAPAATSLPPRRAAAESSVDDAGVPNPIRPRSPGRVKQRRQRDSRDEGGMGAIIGIGLVAFAIMTPISLTFDAGPPLLFVGTFVVSVLFAMAGLAGWFIAAIVSKSGTGNKFIGVGILGILLFIGGCIYHATFPRGRLAFRQMSGTSPQDLAGSATPDPTGLSADDLYHEYAKLYSAEIALREEMASLLETVNGAGTAEQVAPRVLALCQLQGDIDQRGSRLPTMGMGQARMIHLVYSTEQRAALRWLSQEVARTNRNEAFVAALVKAWNDAGRPLVGGPLNKVANFGGPMIPMPNGAMPPNMGLPPGFGPGRPGIPPNAVTASGPTVTVVVTGVPEGDAHKAERDAIGAELQAIHKEFAHGRPSSSSMVGSNGRQVHNFTPVDDARAFADKITFGKVTRVAGQRIDVVYKRSP